MMTVSICTEEKPQINEIEFILEHLGFPCRVSKITSDITGNIWNGKFLAETNNPSLNVVIELVKGSGSCVDYIIYDHLNPDEKSEPILLVESTKTSDSESRNTAINQRFTKFPVAKMRFPRTPLILYYNTKQTANTATNRFGKRLLSTFGVKAYDVGGNNLLTDSPPFTDVKEIMREKNSVKEKKGNVSVKIAEIAPHEYTISAKLSKGTSTKICHDPNKGLVTGIACAISIIDKEARFTITNHGVVTEKVVKPNEKFWYANSGHDLKLEGCELSSKGAHCPSKYWTRDTQSEKAATINYQIHMEKSGWVTVFHNHSSSARSYFTDEQGEEHQVPKGITIPDHVGVNKTDKLIRICEGKIQKDWKKGVDQLNNLTKFLEYLQTYYQGYTIERGLCLYVTSIKDIDKIRGELSYPVFFTLDATGTLHY